jgi:hypothetical protein
MPNRTTDPEIANESWQWYLNGRNKAGSSTFIRLYMREPYD